MYLTQLFLGAAPDAVHAVYRSLTGRAVEDHAVVTVGYPSQAIGVIEAGFVAGTPFTIDLFGTTGRVSYTDDGNHLTAGGPGTAARPSSCRCRTTPPTPSHSG